MQDDLRKKLEKVQAVMLETGLSVVCSGTRDGRITLCFSHEIEGEAYDVEYMEEVSANNILDGDSVMTISQRTY